MKALKYTLLSLVYIVEFVLAFLVSYLMVVAIGLLVPVNADYEYRNDEIQFYVISNGVHTDICLPTQTEWMDWTSFLPFQEYRGIHETPRYVSIGWGDKGFYLDTPTWADLKFSTAFNAAFLPSETAMHITYLTEEPQIGESVKKCSMNEEEYQKLIGYIKESFETDPSKTPILIPNKGYKGNDNFYEANHSYHLMKTCNTWTNGALQISGVRTSFHALFEQGILRWL